MTQTYRKTYLLHSDRDIHEVNDLMAFAAQEGWAFHITVAREGVEMALDHPDHVTREATQCPMCFYPFNRWMWHGRPMRTVTTCPSCADASQRKRPR